MNHRWRTVALSCLMVLALVVTLGLGCGNGGEEKGKVTITIGLLSDMSGPASPALVPINYALADLVSHYNENNLIPGVRFKVVSYDTRYDSSRSIPGYDWLKGKGAKIIFGILSSDGEILKNYVDRDQVPYFSISCTGAMIEPPGWMFTDMVPGNYEMQTMLQWLSENDWDYSKGIPTIGAAGWAEPSTLSYQAGIKQYAEAHPDKFQLVPLRTIPMGGLMWTAEIMSLKDCDYVFTPITGSAISTFMQQYRDAGGKGKFVWCGSHAAYVGLTVDALGWEAIDGIPLILTYDWWTDTESPLAALTNQLLDANHSAGEAAKLRYAGAGYLAGIALYYPAFNIIEATVKAVGAENFTGQAFYDTAGNISLTLPDGQKCSYTPTKRSGYDFMVILRVNAAKQDIVRVSDWIPLVTEGPVK